MKYKIFFSSNGVDDHVVISGDSIDEIKQKAAAFLKRRNLDPIKNSVYSQKVETNE